ncbi:unnamed protein product [Umbelopsis vinacea]
MNRDRSEIDDLLQESRDSRDISGVSDMNPQRSLLRDSGEPTMNEPWLQTSSYDRSDVGGTGLVSQKPELNNNAPDYSSTKLPGSFPSSEIDNSKQGISSSIDRLDQSQGISNSPTNQQSSSTSGTSGITKDYAAGQVDNDPVLSKNSSWGPKISSDVASEGISGPSSATGFEKNALTESTTSAGRRGSSGIGEKFNSIFRRRSSGNIDGSHNAGKEDNAQLSSNGQTAGIDRDTTSGTDGGIDSSHKAGNIDSEDLTNDQHNMAKTAAVAGIGGGISAKIGSMLKRRKSKEDTYQDASYSHDLSGQDQNRGQSGDAQIVTDGKQREALGTTDSDYDSTGLHKPYGDSGTNNEYGSSGATNKDYGSSDTNNESSGINKEYGTSGMSSDYDSTGINNQNGKDKDIDLNNKDTGSYGVTGVSGAGIGSQSSGLRNDNVSSSPGAKNTTDSPYDPGNVDSESERAKSTDHHTGAKVAAAGVGAGGIGAMLSSLSTKKSHGDATDPNNTSSLVNRDINADNSTALPQGDISSPQGNTPSTNQDYGSSGVNNKSSGINKEYGTSSMSKDNDSTGNNDQYGNNKDTGSYGVSGASGEGIDSQNSGLRNDNISSSPGVKDTTDSPYDPGNIDSESERAISTDHHTGAKVAAAGVGAGGIGAMLSSVLRRKSRGDATDPNNTSSLGNRDINANNITSLPQGDISSPQGDISTPEGNVSSAPNNTSSLGNRDISDKSNTSIPRGDISSPQGNVSTTQENVSSSPSNTSNARGNSSALGTRNINDDHSGYEGAVGAATGAAVGSDIAGRELSGTTQDEKSDRGLGSRDASADINTTGAETGMKENNQGPYQSNVSGNIDNKHGASTGTEVNSQTRGNNDNLQPPGDVAHGNDPVSNDDTVVDPNTTAKTKVKRSGGIASVIFGNELKFQGSYKILISKFLHNDSMRDDGLELKRKGEHVLQMYRDQREPRAR